jgi:hypothetical protein
MFGQTLKNFDFEQKLYAFYFEKEGVYEAI